MTLRVQDFITMAKNKRLEVRNSDPLKTILKAIEKEIVIDLTIQPTNPFRFNVAIEDEDGETVESRDVHDLHLELIKQELHNQGWLDIKLKFNSTYGIDVCVCHPLLADMMWTFERLENDNTYK